MKKQLLTLLAATCFLTNLYAQIINRNLPQLGYQTRIQDVYTLPDGVLVIENVTKSSTFNNVHAFCTKLDPSGALIWQKELKGVNFKVKQSSMLSDGRIVLVGFQMTCSNTSPQMTCIMLDSAGEVIWQTALSGAQLDPASVFTMDLSVFEDYNFISVIANGVDDLQFIFRLSDGVFFKETQLSNRVITNALPGVYKGYYEINNKNVKYFIDSVNTKSITLNLPANQFSPEKIFHDSSLLLIQYYSKIVVLDTNGNQQLVETGSISGVALINKNTIAVLNTAKVNHNYEKFLSIYSLSNNQVLLKKSIQLPDLNRFNVQFLGIKSVSNNILVYASVSMSNNRSGDLIISEPDDESIGADYSFIFTIDPETEQVYLKHGDVEITNVEFGAESWMLEQDNPDFYMYKARNVRILIHNYGTETLNTVSIGVPTYLVSGATCAEDTSYFHRFDNLNILPGEEASLLIKELPYSASDQYIKNLICFWAFAPNDHFEGSIGNNSYCTTIAGTELPPASRFNVFPNPVRNQLFISLEKQGFNTARVKISAITGQVVLDEFVYSDGEYFNISTAALASGVYILQVGEHIIKLVKE